MATYDPSYPSTSYGSHPELRLNRKLELRWGSIFGGSVLGWGLLFFLSLLGLTIGLAAIEPYSARPAAGLDTGSGIWAIAALVLSSIVGAYFVVRLAGERRKREAVLHGAVSWGLSMVAGALLAFAASNTAARAVADNLPRNGASPRVDASGNLRMSRADRERLDNAKVSGAKAAGVAAGSSLLSLLGALLGAGLGAAAASGRKIGERFRLGRGHDRAETGLGHTSSAGAGLSTDATDRDRPTILPPTH